MKAGAMQERLTELHFQDDIGMYYCGRRETVQNHHYGPEIRNHYLFVLVHKGEAVLHGKKEISFGAHDLLVMLPQQRIYYEAPDSWSISWLGLYGDGVSGFMDKLGVNPDNPILHISLYRELKDVMDNIYETSEDSAIWSKVLVMGQIYTFFSILLQNATVHHKTDPILAAKKIMDYNFCENITVAQIAARLCVTPAHLSREFAHKIGVSPKKYILVKRIQRAKELLKITNAGIQEISNSVGYEDGLYFCRIFKKHTGMSPTEYRQNAHKMK